MGGFPFTCDCDFDGKILGVREGRMGISTSKHVFLEAQANKGFVFFLPCTLGI